MQSSVNINDGGFLAETELGLARAYSVAFERERLIAEGKFQPFNRKRRRKRYTAINDAAVHVG